MSAIQDTPFSSLFIGVSLIILCLACLYLLYSNFSKSRKLYELEQKCEDLKTIFFTQQKENDKNYAKLVRKGHVQTDEHWMNKPIVPNGLIEALP